MTERKNGFLELHDAKIYFESTGSGPAIVFAHGLAGNYLSWWQQVPFFATGHRCVTFSHRLFFPSSESEGGRGPAAFDEDLEKLLDHLGIEQAILVAQSMGGWTCLRFAVRCPSRVRGLVLGATAGMTPSGAEFLFTDPVKGRQIEMTNSLAILRSSGIIPAAGARMLAEQPVLYFLYQQIDELTPRANKNIAREGFSSQPPIPIAELAKIRNPTLLLTGDEDAVFPSPVAMELSKYLPDARLHNFRKSGHSAFFERAAEYNDLLAQFFASLE
jgi:3-oxoadipate enol-lactonase